MIFHDDMLKYPFYRIHSEDFSMITKWPSDIHGYPHISTIYIYMCSLYISTLYSHHIFTICWIYFQMPERLNVRCWIHLPGPRDGRCGCSAASRHLGRKTTDFGSGIPGDFSQKWCRKNLCFMQMEHIWYDISGNMIRKIPSLQLSIESVPGNGCGRSQKAFGDRN